MKDLELSQDYARSLDTGDELAHFRDKFAVSDPAILYMDGNSLGRMPHAAARRAEEAVRHEWGEDLIGGWNGGWYEAPLRVGDVIGSLLGAAPGQVVVTDSTSVNLFKALVASLKLRSGRRRIVTDTLNFPSDLYVLQGVVELLGGGYEVKRIASLDGGVTPDLDEMRRSIGEETAVLLLSHATYKSGYLYDLEGLTKDAHRYGVMVVWDLSHSAGVVPIELDACGVDFAVGCTYKYLNGGPGAPAYLYVRSAIQVSALSPIWGWFGRREPFAFEPEYTPAQGIARFLAGTPPVVSLLAMEAALESSVSAGVPRMRRKSVAMTEYLIALVDRILSPVGFTVASPRDAEHRGSHVALRHREGYRIAQALIREAGVIPDFREPDLVRFGCVPLYTRFEEIWEAVDRTRRVVEGGLYRHYSSDRKGVT